MNRGQCMVGFRTITNTYNQPRWPSKRRLILLSGDTSNPPKVGDLGQTDQCYTGFWGAMVLVYFVGADGSEWEAEAYESEIEPLEVP